MAADTPEDKKEINNTGFSTSPQNTGDRFINKSGEANIAIAGVNKITDFSVYHYMLGLPNWKFFLIILLFYSTINIIFACIYLFIGVEHLNGMVNGTFWANFKECYFFSSQTLTTVGYGRISPEGLLTNIVSSLEALVGIMTLAIITGLLYGRFVKPRAYLRYSDNALISPFKNGKALMFRMAPTKTGTLSEVSATVTLVLSVKEDGEIKNKFFLLPLELEKIMSLTLSWTIVHPINEESPLYNLSLEDMATQRMQVIVFIKAFDEGFSNTVVSRTSYTWNEIVDNAKFNPMFKNFETQHTTMLNLAKLNDFVRL